ncbi:TlpA family protein disulfide reductase [Crassaminicella profunda]|uniref:TlpA family protein disulfide reductase n=1 Tax=Crassaminicella profunda TaxID=1286698 RepID=UPI001CA686B9|nr:TlpA disulfide reductase family protein [Crassaminicella profunda]QZY55199.1 TlpA family protein disulfide reductase [Crassaminicella profunda]
MLKKLVVTLLIGTIAFTAIGCGKTETKETEKTNATAEIEQQKATEENISEPFKLDDLGISFVMPKKWDDNENMDGLVLAATPGELFYGGLQIFFVPNEALNQIKDITKDGKQPTEKEMQAFFDAEKPLIHFNIYKKELIGKKSIESLSNLKNNILLGEQEGLVYYLSYPNKEEMKSLSPESKKIYDSLYEEIGKLKASVKLFKPIFKEDALKSHKTFPTFKTKDINGKDISSTIFKESKLTMINIWGTFCSPCINEMPDLQELYEEVKKENINVIGIIGDAKGNEKIAKDIIAKTKVTYLNILPNPVIQNEFLKDVSAYPTSIFVDGKGNIVGKPIIGAKSKDDYKKAIMETLKDLSK